MQTGAKISRVLMWISLVVCGGFQWVAIIGIHIQNSRAVAAGSPERAYTIWPLAVAMGVLTLSVFWFAFVCKHRLPAVIAAGAASVALFAAVLDLWQTFEEAVVTSGGLDLWTLIWRHLSSLLIFVFMLITYLLERDAPPKKLEEEQDTQDSTLSRDVEKKE